jgi:hypothetical protein
MERKCGTEDCSSREWMPKGDLTTVMICAWRLAVPEPSSALQRVAMLASRSEVVTS